MYLLCRQCKKASLYEVGLFLSPEKEFIFKDILAGCAGGVIGVSTTASPNNTLVGYLILEV